MWYFDEFEKSSELRTLLLSNFGGNEYKTDNYIVGFVDKYPDISVTHSWKEAGNNLLGTITTAAKHIGKGITDIGESLGNQLTSLIGTTDIDARTTSSLYNMKITNNASMLKEYDGTLSDITIPQFYKYYIYDKDDYSVRNRIKADLKGFNLLGKSSLNTTDIIQSPPNNFKYGYNFEPKLNVAGSYCLSNAKYIIKNLLPTTVNIEFSDVVIHGTSEPVFAKLSISFEYGRKPTQDDVIKFIDNKLSVSNVYTDVSQLIKDERNKIKNSKIMLVR